MKKIGKEREPKSHKSQFRILNQSLISLAFSIGMWCGLLETRKTAKNCQAIHKKDLTPFLAENDDERWYRKKNYFEIPRWPSKLLLPSAKKICPERLDWPGRLAGISEGAR